MNRGFLVAFVLAATVIGSAGAQTPAGDADTFYLREGSPSVNPNSSNLLFEPDGPRDHVQRRNVIKYGAGTPPRIFTVHEHEERDKQLQFDWDFAFLLKGDPPAKLRPGDHFTVEIFGQVTGGTKKEGSGYAFLDLRTPGFTETVVAGDKDRKKVVVGMAREEGFRFIEAPLTEKNQRKVTLGVEKGEQGPLYLMVYVGDNRGTTGYELVRYVWEKKGGGLPRPGAQEPPSLMPTPTPTPSPTPTPTPTPTPPPEEPPMRHNTITLASSCDPIEAPRMPAPANQECCITVRNWCPGTNRVTVSVSAGHGILPLPIRITRTPAELENNADGNSHLDGSYCFHFGWRSERDAEPGDWDVVVTATQEVPPGASDCGGTRSETFKVHIPPPANQDSARLEPGRNGVSGPLNSFAGIFDTTLGPMTIRVAGNRATGVMSSMGLAFNGLVSGHILRGEYRDATGTGSLLMELAEGQPMVHGLLVWQGSPGKHGGEKGFSGTVVQTGDPARTVEPPRAKNDKITFQAPQRWVRPGDTFQVPIWMLNGNGIGSLNLKLQYDPEVIQPVPPPITGNLLAGNALAAINLEPPNERGLAYLGMFHTQGLKAEPVGTLTVLNFRAVGRERDQTPLRLERTTLTMGAGGQPAASEQIDGVVYLGPPIRGARPGTMPVIPPPPGVGTGTPGGGAGTPGSGMGTPGGGTGTPGGGPGTPGGGAGTPGSGPDPTGGIEPPPEPPVSPHTFGDALDALKMSVKMIPENLNQDVTSDVPNGGPDGKVTARDAQSIAQSAVDGVRRSE